MNEALADVLNCQPRTIERWRYHDTERQASLSAPVRLAIKILDALTAGAQTILLRGTAWELELRLKLRPCNPTLPTGRPGASGEDSK